MRQKVGYKPSSVLKQLSIQRVIFLQFLLRTEIAPSCKFKLAANRGLPYLIPHGFSGELLPRRCTITGFIWLLWVSRYCSLSLALSLTISTSYVAYQWFSHLCACSTQPLRCFTQYSSFLWHCPHPHGHLGFPSKFAIQAARTFLTCAY